MSERTTPSRPSIFDHTPDPAEGWAEPDEDWGEVAAPTAAVPVVDPTRP